MSDAVVGAAAALLGVLVGGPLNAWATTRWQTRSHARTAARVALDGLEKWIDGIAYLKNAPTRHAEHLDDFDPWVAIELKALRRHLTLQWWDSTRADLLAVATDDEAASLSRAARASEGILVLLDQVGDEGMEALRKRTALRSAATKKRAALRRAVTKKREASEAAAEAMEASADPAAVTPTDADTDEFVGDAIDKALVERDIEIERRLAEIRGRLDHRIWQARATYDRITTSAGRFEHAASACREIEQRTRSIWA